MLETTPFDFFEMNTDATIRKEEGMMSLGAIIRKEEGEIYLTFLKVIHCAYEVDVAEAMAIREGLRIAFKTGFTTLIVETDSMRLCNMLQSKKEDRYEVGLIVDEIFLMVIKMREITFCHCRGGSNLVTHATAKLQWKRR